MSMAGQRAALMHALAVTLHAVGGPLVAIHKAFLGLAVALAGVALPISLCWIYDALLGMIVLGQRDVGVQLTSGSAAP